MGIISDYYEDSTERYGQYLSATLPAQQFAASLETPIIQPELPCIECYRTFESRESLDAHIRDLHAREHVYLLVNGRVVRETASVPERNARVEVVLLGLPGARVTVRSADALLWRFNVPNKETGFKIPDGFQGECAIAVRPPGRATRRFVLFIRSLPRFAGEKLDLGLSTIHRELDATHARPNLDAWRSLLEPQPNGLEERYVNGFFEYALGLFLEDRGMVVDSKQHFVNALGRLMPFRTGLATTALRALGIKLNSFGLLADVPPHSRFAAASAFFSKGASTFAQQAQRMEPRHELMIDQYSLHCLNAATAYYGSDQASFLKVVGSMERHPRNSDRNNADKLALLTARYERRSGAQARAAAAYVQLLHHPDFGVEAKRYFDEQPDR